MFRETTRVQVGGGESYSGLWTPLQSHMIQSEGVCLSAEALLNRLMKHNNNSEHSSKSSTRLLKNERLTVLLWWDLKRTEPKQIPPEPQQSEEALRRRVGQNSHTAMRERLLEPDRKRLLRVFAAKGCSSSYWVISILASSLFNK